MLSVPAFGRATLREFNRDRLQPRDDTVPGAAAVLVFGGADDFNEPGLANAGTFYLLP